MPCIGAKSERVYKPGAKEEWRVVYWIYPQERVKSNRKQVSFSSLKYGDSVAQAKAWAVIRYINHFGVIPEDIKNPDMNLNPCCESCYPHCEKDHIFACKNCISPPKDRSVVALPKEISTVPTVHPSLLDAQEMDGVNANLKNGIQLDESKVKLYHPPLCEKESREVLKATSQTSVEDEVDTAADDSDSQGGLIQSIGNYHQIRSGTSSLSSSKEHTDSVVEADLNSFGPHATSDVPQHVKYNISEMESRNGIFQQPMNTFHPNCSLKNAPNMHPTMAYDCLSSMYSTWSGSKLPLPWISCGQSQLWANSIGPFPARNTKVERLPYVNTDSGAIGHSLPNHSNNFSNNLRNDCCVSSDCILPTSNLTEHHSKNMNHSNVTALHSDVDNGDMRINIYSLFAQAVLQNIADNSCSQLSCQQQTATLSNQELCNNEENTVTKNKLPQTLPSPLRKSQRVRENFKDGAYLLNSIHSDAIRTRIGEKQDSTDSLSNSNLYLEKSLLSVDDPYQVPNLSYAIRPAAVSARNKRMLTRFLKGQHYLQQPEAIYDSNCSSENLNVDYEYSQSSSLEDLCKNVKGNSNPRFLPQRGRLPCKQRRVRANKRFVEPVEKFSARQQWILRKQSIRLLREKNSKVLFNAGDFL